MSYLWPLVLFVTQLTTTADRSTTELQENGGTAGNLSRNSSHAEGAKPLYVVQANLLEQLGSNLPAVDHTATVARTIHGKVQSHGNISIMAPQHNDTTPKNSFTEIARREVVYLKPSGQQVRSKPTQDSWHLVTDPAKDAKGSETKESSEGNAGGEAAKETDPNSQGNTEAGDDKKEGTETHEEADEAVGASLGGLYVFFLCFFAVTVYMLNFPDPQVKSYSHKAIHFCVCIFATLLTTECVRETFFDLIEPVLGEIAFWAINYFLFIGWYASITYISHHVHEHRPDDVFPTLGLLGHLTAFTLLEPVVEVEYEVALEIQHEYGNAMVLGFYLVIAGVTLGLLAAQQKISGIIRQKVGLAPATEDAHPEHGNPEGDEHDGAQAHHGEKAEGEHGHGDKSHKDAEGEHGHGEHGHGHGHHHDHWLAEVVETETEVTALVAGKLIYIFCYSVSSFDVFHLNCSKVVCASGMVFKSMLVVFMLAACVCTWYMGKVKSRKQAAGEEHELVEFVEAVCVASTGFLMHSSAYQVIGRNFEVPGARAGRKFLSAAFSSPLAFASLIGFDFLADQGHMNVNGVENMARALGMYLGIEWEDAFASGTETFDEFNHFSTPLMVKWITAIGLCSCILPVWRLYVVPIASKPVPHN